MVTRFFISLLIFIRNAPSTLKCICNNSNYRSIFFLKLLKSKNVHQTTSLTFMDRYPRIFSECCDYFEDKHDLKILSFGCSTGEEVLTLRQYFPNALIIGAEINKKSLKKCKRLPADEKIAFIYSKPKQIKSLGLFDAIFCMAVLQRTPHLIANKGITNLKKIYPFKKFNQQIIDLDKLLKLQGLLVIHFSQYLFKDCSVASKYYSMNVCLQEDIDLPLFDKNSNLIISSTPQKSIFIKSRA